jgi:hypothetical protein
MKLLSEETFYANNAKYCLNKKVNLLLGLIKHYSMKTYGGVDV